MDFFEQQSRTDRSTKLLLFLFLVSVILYGCAVVLALLLGTSLFLKAGGRESVSFLLQPEIIFAAISLFVAVLGFGAMFSYLRLQANIEQIILAVGGRLADPEIAIERRLQNVVEEVAIAASIPVPLVVVMPDEMGINAIAVGTPESESIVGLTYGALSHLDRGELQAVVAHEIGHIVSGDTLQNVKLLALISGMQIFFSFGVLLCDFGSGAYAIVHSMKNRLEAGSAGSSNEMSSIPVPLKPAIVLLGLPFCVVGYFGVCFSHILRFGISRQREYHADARAVQLTRDSKSLSRALQKIASFSQQSILRTKAVKQINHMLFAEGFRSWTQRIYSTHPPIKQRISSIDPDFSGEFSSFDFVEGSVDELDEETPSQALAKQLHDHGALVSAPQNLVEILSWTGFSELGSVRGLLSTIPQGIRGKCHSCEGAQAVILALLLSTDDTAREKQMRWARTNVARGVFEELKSISYPITLLPPTCRMPLVDLASMSLFLLAPEQREKFLEKLDEFSKTLESKQLFSLVLRLLLESRLIRTSDLNQLVSGFDQSSASKDVIVDTVYCFLVFSRMSNDHDFLKKGVVEVLDLLGEETQLEAVLSKEIHLEEFEKEIRKFAKYDDESKKLLLKSLLCAAGADERISVFEVELIRGIASIIGVAVPPFDEILERIYE